MEVSCWFTVNCNISSRLFISKHFQKSSRDFLTFVDSFDWLSWYFRTFVLLTLNILIFYRVSIANKLVYKGKYLTPKNFIGYFENAKELRKNQILDFTRAVQERKSLLLRRFLQLSESKKKQAMIQILPLYILNPMPIPIQIVSLQTNKSIIAIVRQQTKLMPD